MPVEMLKTVLFSLAAFTLSCSHVTATGSSTLLMDVFISGINGTDSFIGGPDVGRPFVEAVQLAVELINNDTALLPGYTLDYDLTDTQVSKLVCVLAKHACQRSYIILGSYRL